MSHPFIPVPNVASVEVIWSFNGITAENQFYVQKGSPYTLAQLQSLRGTVDTWDNASWKSQRTTTNFLVRIRTKARDDSTSPTEDYYLPTPRAGTQAVGNQAANVTFAIKLATGHAGRSMRGRWYVAGIGQTWGGTTNNQINTTTANNMVSALNTLMSNLATAGHTLGVVSYRTGGVWRDTGLFTAATGYVAVDYNLDSMRRRLTGRGIT